MNFLLNAFAYTLKSEEKGRLATLIEELYIYFKETYFTIDYGEYGNLGINPNESTFSVETFIIFAVLGMVIACFMGSFNKGTLGQFVRDLISEECFSPESAKTLTELGYLKDSAVRASLKRGYTLRKVVRCVEEDNGTLICRENKDGTVPFNEVHFYIPEELKYKAAVRFEGKKTSKIVYFFLPLIAIALIIFFIKVFPNLLAMLNDFVGLIQPESNILT